MGLCVGGSAVTGVCVGGAPAAAVYLGGAEVWRAGGGEAFSHATLEEYTLGELKAVSADLTANGSQSAYWQRFAGFLGQRKDFGARTGSYAGAGDDAKVIAQLVGMCHDDRADGSGKAGLTFLCDRSLAYAYQMNASNSNSGGWSSSKMRTTLNSGEVWSSLPAGLRNVIVSVKKRTNNTGQTSSTSAVTETTDKVWLASGAELYGSSAGSGLGDANLTVLPLEGTQYEHFASRGVASASYSLLADRNQTNTGGAIQSREGSLSSGRSWLRSSDARESSSFMNVTSLGVRGTGIASSGCGACVGFSI